MTEDVRNIDINDYDYPLPEERIAKYPVRERDKSKLLVYRGGTVSEDVFCNIAAHLPEGALMVYNNTKVIQARLRFRKDTGAVIEIFLLEPSAPADYEQAFQSRGRCSWLCLVGNMKRWRGGQLTLDAGAGLTLAAENKGARHTSFEIEFVWDDDSMTFADIIDRVGEMPIPPYLNRRTEESDKRTYQTVYSKIKGSVAAPTAGLHFSESVLADIDAHGIEREEITLHVGAGTFRPVKSTTIAGHEMHREYIAVSRRTLERLRAHGCRAIAVGTTTVRTLESLYYMGVRIKNKPSLTEEEMETSQWEPYDSDTTTTPAEALDCLIDYMRRDGLDVLHTSTRIIIVPGYKYKFVSMLVTNFHQPKSTLLLLVSAFVGDDWKMIYDYALSHGFRFLSYGDSSLLVP